MAKHHYIFTFPASATDTIPISKDNIIANVPIYEVNIYPIEQEQSFSKHIGTFETKPKGKLIEKLQENPFPPSGAKAFTEKSDGIEPKPVLKPFKRYIAGKKANSLELGQQKNTQ